MASFSLSHQRHEPQTTAICPAGRPCAIAGLRQSGASRNSSPSLFAAAVAQHQAGALAEAERRYRHIVSLAPAHAETHSRLGAALMAQGKAAEAIGPIERALALQPDLFEALGNLAQAYLATGRPEQAIHVLSRAFAIKQTPQGNALFAQSVKAVRFTADAGSGIRQLLLRALAEGWARPRELTGACISLITLSATAKDCIRRATAAWPARLSVAELCGPSGLAILADDPLLCRLLETDPVTDIGLERLLTSVRYAMLTSAAGGAYDESLLGFYCAVARQCFINEYVFSLEAAEAELAQRLRAGLEAALEAGTRCSPLWPVVAGAYFPLHTVAGAERLLDPSWPQSVQALLAQQIVEPAEERRLAATLPALTAIDGAVSRAVRDQYEENPYPRWAAAGRLEPAAPGEWRRGRASMCSLPAAAPACRRSTSRGRRPRRGCLPSISAWRALATPNAWRRFRHCQHRIRAGRSIDARTRSGGNSISSIHPASCIISPIRGRAGGYCCRYCEPAAPCRLVSTANWRAGTSSRRAR